MAMHYSVKVLLSIVIGYLFGTVSPAAIISKVKKMNLRKNGTGNLGATNVMINLGKRYGLLVMLFDMAKAFAAVKITSLIFTLDFYLGMIAGVSSIVGHVFPFYMRFKGGKGLAAFAGLVLAYDPWVFLFLLILTIILIIIVNYSFAMPYSAGILFPVMVFAKSSDIWLFGITAIASAIIMYKHYENIKKARNGTDFKVREFIRKKLFKSTKENNG